MRQTTCLTDFALALFCMFLLVPIAPGQTSAAVPQPVAATIPVKMIDPVDSSLDPAGKQYRAGVIRPINIGNGVMVAQGSPATVVLVKNGSGWSVHLSSLIINGQVVPVTSNSGSVIGAAAQSAAANAANARNAMLEKLGRKPGFSVVAAVATGERVILTPGITLSFVLSAIPQPNAATGTSNLTAAGQPTAGASQPAAASGAPLSANVKETRLGPSNAGWFVVSPDGGHMAIFSMHGSREIIVLDGVDGPEFDHAAPQHDVVFSPDGKRSVYLAQHGDNLVAVVDGKEAYTVETVAPTHGGVVPGIDQSHVHDTGDKLVQHQFLISQSGAHIACVTVDVNNLSHVFLDGAKSQDYRTVDLAQVAFVGENLVYAAQTGDDKWHMFVNHKPGPAYDSVKSLELSDDNRHYAFIGGQNGGNSVVVADGVPGTPRPGGGLGIHGLVIASNGRVAYLGYTLNGRGDPSSESLFVGDQQVSPETSPITSTFKTGAPRSDVKVVFSPDGKKFAYAKPVPGGIAAIIDGKQSIAYDGIGLIQFSPDSRRAFFVGKKGIGNFVVIDGQEMPGQGMVKNLMFSQDGSRFGYEAYDGQLGFTMVVDGKQSGKFWNLLENSLSFSSDGKHSVYVACTQYGKCQVVEDGTTTNVPGLYTFQTRMPPRIVFPLFLFSPDNTRLVYAYPKPYGPNENTIVINGQEIAHGPNFTYRCFSPDSKHFAAGTWTGKGYGVLVDGKVGPTYDDIVEANANPNIFRFEDAHTLRFLGVKGGSVYRVTIDLGSAP
jgi:hypothetical protein